MHTFIHLLLVGRALKKQSCEVFGLPWMTLRSISCGGTVYTNPFVVRNLLASCVRLVRVRGPERYCYELNI